jgi:oligo-1,6-glucosidase
MVDLDEAKLLCDPERQELDMLFYFEHLEVDRYIARYVPKKFRAKKLLSVLTKWQRGLAWNAVYLENHDQPRVVSHYGDDAEFWERSAKLLATMQFTLGGTMFLYQGQEIGMTNFDFTELTQLNDVESFNINELMRRLGIPAKTRWHWIRISSRDNARTPMQWSGEPGAGFTTGEPWLAINKNHVKINYQEQQNRTDSLYKYYQDLITLRAGSDTLKYGKFTPAYAHRNVIAYRRTLGAEKYLIILNFSTKTARADFAGEVILSNTGRKTYDGTLQAYEAVLLRI